jgi:phenylacetate-CoA ligase
MLQRAKELALRGATRLPPRVAVSLARANIRPQALYGRGYRAYREHLARHRTQFDNTPQLLALVNDAIAHVPFYRERYAPLSSLDEFKTLGTITRDDVTDAFIRDDLDRSQYESCSTGGTSGKPLHFLAPKNRYIVELATMHALWATAGYQGDLRAVIRNHRLPADREFIANPITREVIFDGFRLDDTHLERIYDWIAALDLRFVHCYPSTAYELASLIKRRGWNPRGLVFLSGSETIHANQRQLIQEDLGIRFYNWYGHSEKLVLGGYCAGNDQYHVEPTYGFCELLDERGAPVTKVGEVGEIVGTTLHNPGMPFIRYRTGDFARLAGTYCAACDRHVLLLEDIKGRWNGERIYRANGTFVTTTALNLHHELNTVIAGLQYIQEARGRLTVLVVPTREFADAHRRQLAAHFRSTLGEDTAIEIETVERLRRRPNGKFSLVMSALSESTA